jgi:hypothetical protein
MIVLDGTNGITTSGDNILGDASTDILNVGNGGLVKDAAGNVGVGVTPSSWGGSYNKAVQVGATGAISSRAASGNVTDISNNLYLSNTPAWTYLTTAGAGVYEMNAATHVFYSAVSGTAGTTATLINDAVINQYGIGLGNTTPSSGMGIAFPASQSASSDANTLDDYEEGTWTPSMGTGSTQPGSLTYVNRGGNYTKIGRYVTAWFYMNITVSSSGTGNPYVAPSSLPFAPASNSLTGSAGSRGGFVTSCPNSGNHTALDFNNVNPASADACYFTPVSGSGGTQGAFNGVYAGYVMYEAA